MPDVLGRPVTGEITPRGRHRRSPQRSGEEFLVELDKLLDSGDVEAVRWTQYTPYFNDGEPCEFRLGEPHAKAIGDDESGDYEDGFVDSFQTGYYDRELRTYVRNPVPEHLVAAEEALREFSRAFWDFEEFLEVTFGDHARVTATKAGFNVEFYHHD